MRCCVVNCLYIAVVCQFVFTSLVSAKEPGNPQEHDFDSKKLLSKSMDKTDWVDYGDMFTYDPATKTNREPKLKTAVEQVIKRKREAQEKADLFESSHCDQVEQKLKECEAKQKLTCDCARNEHCGKLSYLIVRRLIMKLSKLIDDQYSSGSKIGLAVNLDDFFFDSPLDFSDLTDCDYLIQINPLIDRLMSSVEVSRPKSNNISEFDLYKYLYKYAPYLCAAIAVLLLAPWFIFKISNRTRVYTLFAVFLIMAYIIEYGELYQIKVAHADAVINRLKFKCTQQDDPGWSGWLISRLPAMNFITPENECQDYFTAMHVSPFLQVNPIQPIFSIPAKTFLYLMKLFADASGASVALFFSHIPALYFIPILIAAVVLFVYAMKYFFKYRNSPRVIFPKQKNIFIDNETKPSQNSTETIRDETKPKLKRRAKRTLVKCSSLGNIRDLCL